MPVSHVKDIPLLEVNAPGCAGVTKQSLIGPPEGWKDNVMRLFTLKKDGHSPRHIHPWPHINYITQGKGVLFLEGREYPVEPGSVAYVPEGKEHQFLNRGETEFSFICIVPLEGDK